MECQTPDLSKQEVHLRAAADTSVSGGYAGTLLSKPHAAESLLEQLNFPALASIRRPSRGLTTNLNTGPQLCNAGTLVRRAADVSAQRLEGDYNMYTLSGEREASRWRLHARAKRHLRPRKSGL